ncbi:fatty acid desaturase-domain-containing protein [Epithele typhae]|uniref:fatty acid desaturase-domain-containing protein n=1 Tax=Epithele typhae TaxID=378194 RepID=UPI00200733EA|nr:fatty acid desaturase-domain-containing protein [Epithele typhae]KAH9941308.1 fatty acid desaturase-domain-containing protein [Epithele typhae]
MFKNGPEYEERLARPYAPPTITLKELHAAVPKHLLQKSALRSAGYIARDVAFVAAFFCCAAYIEPLVASRAWGLVPAGAGWWRPAVVRALLWTAYWWWQGIAFTSFFCIVCVDSMGVARVRALTVSVPQLGHGTLFKSWWANNVPGFLLDTFVLAPFFAWKASHNAHHKAVNSVERDENYVPALRSEFSLPPPKRATTADYAEVFEETPLFTMVRMFVMQAMGWWLYLSVNKLGSKMYPKGTNHFSPYSALWKKEQRFGIVISDIGLIAMMSLLYLFARTYGWKAFVAYYFIPYMLCNHWIVMVTFLHHSDPTIPHFRKEEWSFLRGASSTVDRPTLGWIGRFFFHNVSHDHVAHHFFSHIPFYNQPAVTEAIKGVLREHYNYDSTNTFYALYRSFTECCFIEDDGSIVFYCGREGQTQRALAEGVVEEIKEKGWSQEHQDQLAEGMLSDSTAL